MLPQKRKMIPTMPTGIGTQRYVLKNAATAIVTLVNTKKPSP